MEPGECRVSDASGPKQAEATGRKTGIEMQFLAVSKVEDFDAASSEIVRHRTQALLVLVDPYFTLNRHAVVELASRNRLLAVSGVREFAEGGGLMAYAPSYFEDSKRGAVYVDRILKGARPAELPVEQSTTFELVLNLRTARLLGLAIPPSLLIRATEVIE